MILAKLLELWNSSWPAGTIMLGLGGCFALILLIASKRLKVEVDPKIEEIHEVLPNIDCGACGFAGCSSYAKAILSSPELIGKCAPGGAQTAEKIGAILNLQISASGPAQRPIVHCHAYSNDKTYSAVYQGIPTCIAANALANVQACTFGCLGFGDCVSACKFDALHLSDGLAIVDYEKCTGCAACSKACVRNLIKMVPFTHENMLAVACSSRESGKSTRAMCKVGCIGCGLCAKQTDIFSLEDNLAYLDYEKYQPCEETQTAMTKCPTKVIVLRGKTAPADTRPTEKAATV